MQFSTVIGQFAHCLRLTASDQSESNVRRINDCDWPVLTAATTYAIVERF